MKHLFNFNPDCTVINIKLAFEYTPKILKNQITHRPYTGLLYVVHGQYEYKYNGGEFTAGDGSIIYLPPQSAPYSYRIFAPDECVSVQTMQIEFDLQDIHTNQPLAYTSRPTLLTTDAPTLCNNFKTVISSFSKKDVNSKLSLYADLFSLLSTCAKLSEDKPASLQRKLAPALTYLQENYTKQITVKTLADLCYISESQLRRSFHTLLGKSPIAYKNELICDAAKSLLQSSEFSIGEIANMLGFYDIYAFSHFFSSYVGISPTAYKKTV